MNVKKNKVTKVTPAATATPAAAITAKAKKATPAAPVAKVAAITSSKYKGVTTGMRVMEFQDSTFVANFKKMLTDAELVALWRAEFPEAIAFTVAHLSGARRDYNNGRHSKNAARPDAPLGAALIVAGKRVWASDVKATDAPAPKAPKAKAAAKAAPVVAQPTAKATAKAVRRLPKAS